MENKLYIDNVGSLGNVSVVAKRAEIDSKLNALNTELVLSGSMGNLKTLDELRDFYRENPEHLPTGIDFIDDLTNGGLYSDMTILAGVPNVGKSTLLVQIAVEYSKQGIPVVYVNKDMRSQQIKLKLISYIISNIEGANIISTNDITGGYVIGKDMSSAGKEVINNLSANLHIVDYDSGVWDCIEDSSLSEASNMGRIIEIYSKIYKSSPVFIIDNLQGVALHYEKSNKESVDVALAELKRLGRKFDARMVVVSNLNRTGYGKGIEYSSLKESGNIEFEASCILAMEISGNAVNQNDFRNGMVRRVKIKNLKDRAGGYKEVVVEFDVLRSTFSSIKKHTPAPAKSGKGRSSDKAASGGIKSAKGDGGFMDKFDKPLDDLALEALEMLKKA